MMCFHNTLSYFVSFFKNFVNDDNIHDIDEDFKLNPIHLKKRSFRIFAMEQI